MFVFGTQYLRGFTPERDQWERDLQNIKALGFNTVRAWLVWNCIERSEGCYDLDYVRHFLDLCKKNDLQVGLLFHLHAAPAWAIEKYPEYYYMDADGNPFEPAVRPNTPSGGWPGLCFDHPEVRHIEERFIKAVLSVTKDYDNVAFYEPMNEPHQWVDMTKKPNGIFCYCPASVKKYQQWLKKKYKTIEALNNAWGYFYESFDQVRPPRWTASFSDYIDFRQFTVENIADEIAWRTSVLKKYDNKPVIAHAWGGGAVTCPQLGGMAFDDWKNAEIFDKWGYSAFPSTKEDSVMLGLGCDATRSAANGKEFWQSELTAGITGGIFHQTGRIDNETFDQFSLESIRHGAKGLLYWQYRKERLGPEMGGYAMADFDGGPTPLTARAAAIGKLLSENEDLFKKGESASAKIALVFSIRSYFADWAATGRKNNKMAVDSLSGYYRMFWEENIPVDILHEEFSNDLSQYELIILPSAMAIAPSFAEKLKTFVFEGGTLLSEPAFGLFDPTFKLSYHVPGYGFDEVFGAHQDDLQQKKRLFLRGEENYLFENNHFAERYKEISAEVLLRYEDGAPAILSNSYGKGRAILSGINLGLCYSGGSLIGDDFKEDSHVAIGRASKKFLWSILKLPKNPCSAEDVKVTILSNKGEALVILINSAPFEKSGSVALEQAYSVAHSVYNECSPFLQGNQLQFALAPNASAVVRLK